MVRASGGISRRILDLFDYQDLSTIVFQVKVDSRHVHDVIEGYALPSTELLLSIQKVTGASLDWVLTGQGNKFLPLPRFIVSDNVRRGPWGSERERVALAR